MTCVVGLLHDGRVYMGADSAATEPQTSDQFILSRRKVTRKGPYLIGTCGEPRYGDIMRHCFAPPEPDWDDIDRFMADEFTAALRACFEEHGWLERKDGRAVASGSEALIGVNKRLFVVGEYFQSFSLDEYCAVGTGMDFAFGSLYSTEGKPPRERVLEALKAAQKFNAACREPFIIEELEPPSLKCVISSTHVLDDAKVDVAATIAPDKPHKGRR